MARRASLLLLSLLVALLDLAGAQNAAGPGLPIANKSKHSGCGCHA